VSDAILDEFGKIGIHPTLHVERSHDRVDSVGAAPTAAVADEEMDSLFPTQMPRCAALVDADQW
jgi:hypothetical protein